MPSHPQKIPKLPAVHECLFFFFNQAIILGAEEVKNSKRKVDQYPDSFLAINFGLYFSDNSSHFTPEARHNAGVSMQILRKVHCFLHLSVWENECSVCQHFSNSLESATNSGVNYTCHKVYIKQ